MTTWMGVGLVACTLGGLPCAGQQATGVPVQVPAATRAAVDRLIDAALVDTVGWARLGELVDAYPGRLGGSRALDGALDWALARMKADGLENVHAENVLVGCADEACAIRVWARSPHHRANMLLRGVTYYEIGRAHV